MIKDATVAEFQENAGKKMVGLGKKRRLAVARILSDAMNRHSKMENIVRRLKNDANTPKKKDKRNWATVVQTEYTDARAKASLDLIISVFGEDTTVYRDPDPDCCDQCKKLLKGKKFRAGSVPKAIIGSIHPNCVCPTWKTLQQPDLTKSLDELADVPVGHVRRVTVGNDVHAEISTGEYWVSMDSPTGRSVMRTVLMNMPAVGAGARDGYTFFAHGRFQSPKDFTIWNLAKLGDARFYQRSFLDGKNEDKLKIHDLSQYLTAIRAALPTIATMPEFWQKKKIRYLTDFMSYKTLTDWVLAVPGQPHESAHVVDVSSKNIDQRRAVREYTQWRLDSASRMNK